MEVDLQNSDKTRKKRQYPSLKIEKKCLKCVNVCLSVCLSFCLSIYLSFRLSIYLSVCLPVCLAGYLYIGMRACKAYTVSVYFKACVDGF